MATRNPRRPIVNRSLRSALIVLAILVAAGGYGWVLKAKNQAVAERFEHLQHSNTRAYLSHVRLTRGFKAYLKEYVRLRHADDWRRDAPPFLVGRWALFDKAKRVSEAYFPEVCLDAAEIEDGRFKRLAKTTATHRARYRMDGDRVVVEFDGNREVPITLKSYGTALHHIVVTLPGEKRPHYGYLCK